MRIHYLQHVSFEGLGSIQQWATQEVNSVRCTKVWESNNFPSSSDYDWLIIMGGPMGVHDEKKHPWLKAEKQFIENAIKSDKVVIGICLGAQLIADVLGAKVFPSQYKEIGWFPVHLTNEGKKVLGDFPEDFTAFHWHGDTFDLPSGAKHLAGSVACKNQAFLYDKVLGLQFHLESTEASVKALIDNCRQEIVPASHIQNEESILNHMDNVPSNSLLMTKLLNFMHQKISITL